MAIEKNFEKRRKKFLSELKDNSIVIIPNKKASIRSNDVEYKFKPDSDFYYLTGFSEPDSICVLIKERKSILYFLFVEPRDKEREIWVGKRAGVEGAKSYYGADKAYEISQIYSNLEKMIKGKECIYYALGKNKEMDQKIICILEKQRKSNRDAVKTSDLICDPTNILSRMRLVKDSYEIDCIQRAANISKAAHIAAISSTRAGMYEYELEAIIEYKFRASGALGTAYPSIVGSGKNSTILHYIDNNKKMQNGELVLIDAGCEYEYYASDLTRTFPVSGKFTPLQKDLYQLVLEAQIKSIEQLKPGKKFIDSYNKAVHVLACGLKELKLLKGSVSEIISKRKYRKFFMHRLSHWLGLDVHDAGPYIDNYGKSIKLESGMVMTVEPGIYISSDMDEVPEKFRGIGIRIEDDVLITKKGNKVLTEGTPKTIKEIEALC